MTEKSPKEHLCGLITDHLEKNNGQLPQQIGLFVKVIEMYANGVLHGQFGVIPSYTKEFGEIVFGLLSEKAKTPDEQERYDKLGKFWSENYNFLS